MSQPMPLALTIEQLYHEYHQPLWRYLARLVSDRETAEDLCHETFIKALRHWGDRDQAAGARLALPDRHQHGQRSSPATAPGGDHAADRVQYFERARFEYHPANLPAYQVEIGLLGSQLIATALPVKQVNVTVVAGPAQTTIGLDETALVVSDAPNMTVVIQFPEPVDPSAFQVQLHQIPGRDAWQVAPASRTPSRGAYVFDLHGGVGRPDYVRVDVTRGVANPILVFGIQVGNGQITPSLLASWNVPDGLVQSYYNAVSRHEYARAYGYWETPGAPNAVTPIFKDFVRGYANVASVEVTTGTILSDAGAGNLAYQVPAVISATQTDGTSQRFYGCYLLHRVNFSVR